MSIKKSAGLSKILLVAALFLLVGLVAGAVQASEGIRLIASEEKGESGEKVKVAISVESAAGISGGEATLNFDPALVKPVADEPGELVIEAASGMFMANREYDEGQLRFMWVTPASDAADEGIICLFEFELLDTGETELEFADVIISPDGIELAEPVSGWIIVGETEVGQQEIEENEVDREEEAIAEEVEDEDEKAAVEAVDDGNNYTMVIVLLILLILGAVGFMFFKRKRPKSAKLS